MRYYYYVIAVLVFIVDYVTKKMIVKNLELGEQISVIGDFFLITSHRNRGAAFGILQNQRLFFILITIVVVAGIIWYIHTNRRSGNRTLLVGLGLVLGGALGNFLDRAQHGEVVDFLQFNFGSYTFPIFNVADSGIVCGVILILLDTLLSARAEQAEQRKQASGNSTHHEGQGSEQA
ncbi:signal peptidase II [Paenibacillus sp. GCM10023252]|uniref:signal peptidase II n=1 Tax=Paenibacillus sp. GCM10023252 TaxID=3252649 RepID=UPI003622D2E3